MALRLCSVKWERAVTELIEAATGSSHLTPETVCARCGDVSELVSEVRKAKAFIVEMPEDRLKLPCRVVWQSGYTSKAMPIHSIGQETAETDHRGDHDITPRMTRRSAGGANGGQVGHVGSRPTLFCQRTERPYRGSRPPDVFRSRR